MYGLSIVCSGIFAFVFREYISVDEPKSPVSNGKSGCFIGRFNEANPRKPASKKIINEFILDSFSLKIKKIEIQIKNQPIIRFMNGYIFGIIVKKKGIRKIREIIAIEEPITVKIIASCPRPLSKNLCPGSAESPVSSSGAPKNIEGIKSMNVCVIAIATIKIKTSFPGTPVRNVDVKSIEAIKFIWIPGIKPVNVPAKIPKNIMSIEVIMGSMIFIHKLMMLITFFLFLAKFINLGEVVL